MKLQLEMNKEFIPSDDTFKLGDKVVMITPAINEDYWIFRVKVSKEQSIVGFPKFGTVGVGFAKETDWNANLPFSCDSEKIYNHIRHNKGNKNIRRADCLKAITMIQKAAHNFKYR